MNRDFYSRGLTSVQAEKLLIKHGYNQLSPGKQLSYLTVVFSQFDNFLTLLLILAAVVSLFLAEYIDGIFIFLIVILNAIFGVYQEFKAEKALTSLKKMTVSTIRVIRNGEESEIDNRLLVPGDLIYLEQGSKIPADCTLINSYNLEVNEASLTGESIPVEKSENKPETSTIFLGTVVASGRGYAIVTSTADRTKFGAIARKLSEIKRKKTPLQEKLESFSQQLGVIGLGAAIVVFILSFIQDKSLFESFIFAISLAVAAVPEGLPAVMTITLAIGIERMAKKKSIIRKLNAIETLGSISLIATDKTGTLTTNQMRVNKLWLNWQSFDSGKTPDLNNPIFNKILLNGILCSTSSLVYHDENKTDMVGDATEGALLYLANESKMNIEDTRLNWKLNDESLFNQVTKRMTVLASSRKSKWEFSKGAPESILSICNSIQTANGAIALTGDLKKRIENSFEKFAQQGLRIIAFSYKDGESKIMEKQHIFLGFVGISDPIRKEVNRAVAKALLSGIKTVMITGDNALTAQSIGLASGIISKKEHILIGDQLDKMSDEKLMKLLPKIKIFARTTPIHKYRLVKLLQQLGEVVAVTGDGVNDILALKQADVGIAMGETGTDVAKDTADMIIMDDNFATIINAVEQGRNIINQIKNAIKYLLSCNSGEVFYILLAVIFNLPILIPLQILYINLVTDGLPAISLAFSPIGRDILKNKFRKSNSFLNKFDYYYIFAVGGLTAILGLISILFFRNSPYAQTMVFTVITFIQPLILADLWLSHQPIKNNFRLFLNPVFLSAFFFPFILHPFLIYLPFFQKVFKTQPLNVSHLGLAFLLSTLILIPHLFAKTRR